MLVHSTLPTSPLGMVMDPRNATLDNGFGPKSSTGLTTVLRHMSFAAHRWESTVVPQRRYVFLQSSIALLLSLRAADLRLTGKERDRALSMLETHDPSPRSHSWPYGRLGDDAGRLVKIFEAQRLSDIALAKDHLDDYKSRVSKLYIDGGILVQPDQPDEDENQPFVYHKDRFLMIRLLSHRQV